MFGVDCCLSLLLAVVCYVRLVAVGRRCVWFVVGGVVFCCALLFVVGCCLLCGVVCCCLWFVDWCWLIIVFVAVAGVPVEPLLCAVVWFAVA